MNARRTHGTPAGLSERVLASGDGWQVRDVICTSGPRDRSFREQHGRFSVSVVAAGTFQYTASGSRHVMTPGSIMLGNAGETFECGHEHASGDRCISFSFDRDYLAEAGSPGFGTARLPPLQAFSAAVARVCSLDENGAFWEELGLELAGRSLEASGGRAPAATRAAEARVTRAIRMIEREPSADLALRALAREARLSPYHFLRVFEQVTGVTPHQFVLRTRLRRAALRLAAEPSRIVDIALDCGFSDVSNFNRAFRAEFGFTPGLWRRSKRREIVSPSRS